MINTLRICWFLFLEKSLYFNPLKAVQTLRYEHVLRYNDMFLAHKVFYPKAAGREPVWSCPQRTRVTSRSLRWRSKWGSIWFHHIIEMRISVQNTYSVVCVIRCGKEPLEQNAAWCLHTRKTTLLMQRNISRGSRSTTRGSTRTTKSLCKTSKDPFIDAWIILFPIFTMLLCLSLHKYKSNATPQ